jgi:23S rRNA (uracil1939-C5)-methyltransferase
MTTLTIDRLGALGDGVAETQRGPVYIPFALPSERVDAAI